jgi:hypothetical protein
LTPLCACVNVDNEDFLLSKFIKMLWGDSRVIMWAVGTEGFAQLLTMSVVVALVENFGIRSLVLPMMTIFGSNSTT